MFFRVSKFGGVFLQKKWFFCEKRGCFGGKILRKHRTNWFFHVLRVLGLKSGFFAFWQGFGSKSGFGVVWGGFWGRFWGGLGAKKWWIFELKKGVFFGLKKC